MPAWEGRFTVAPANPTDAHRPLRREHDLAAILSVVEARVVTNDYTLRYQGKSYQIARADVGGGLRGAKVRVEKRLDGTVAVKFRDRYLTVSECPAGQKPEGGAGPGTGIALRLARPGPAVPAKLDGRVLPPGEPAAVEGAEAGWGTRDRPRGGPMKGDRWGR